MILRKTLKARDISSILSDLKLGIKVVVNITFFIALFVFLLEMKSLLEIDIFPNYNFPLDEMINEIF